MAQNNYDEQPILTLIQQIKDSVINPETLPKELRQRCVEVLLGEGYNIVTMAQILKRSEKTIKRDLENIRERNAISPDINLAKKIIGEMLMYARINRDHLMKLARTKDASVSEKAQAEYLASRVTMELIQKMQTLGYLPLKPQTIVSDIFHHADNAEQDISFTELRAMLIDIVNTAKETNTLTPELEQEAENLKIKIEKTEVISEVKNLKQKHQKTEE